ncbi:MAG: nucleotidyl transferase AbiEii/AbiGii toxin family protein [Peptococcaceae bacterium]|jgi:predicted nucleotidyltransferase component of viral defense system|nr:nucleotidyl transferase AbiEii/AbiGii toxin family protein [Peptococcaceae bacterium]
MNEWQEERKIFMEKIAQEITASTNDTIVLKGGTALLLAYALDRFSEDMDFDGKYSVELEKHIECAASKCGIAIKTINLSKNTDVTRRYKVHYETEKENRPHPLVAECSFRQASTINEADVVEINGIRVYRVNKLAEQKVAAFLRRERARDIWDIRFLLRRYPEAFNDNILERLINGIDKKGIDAILETYEKDSKTDYILSNTDGATVVRELEEMARGLKHSRDRSRAIEKPARYYEPPDRSSDRSDERDHR